MARDDGPVEAGSLVAVGTPVAGGSTVAERAGSLVAGSVGRWAGTEIVLEPVNIDLEEQWWWSK